ncbi:hypothetical protein K8S17_01455 [bacterium]|nr:hypothetical protein [bacterium]
MKSSPSKEQAETRDEKRKTLDGFAVKIVERKLTAPAILFIESMRPLSFIGNQAMVFFQPIVQTIFNSKSYDNVMDLLEDRDNIEYLLKKIEELEAEEQKKARDAKKRRKEQKAAAKSQEEG